MKYLFLLIALMKIMILSRRHLSRRTKRRDIYLTILAESDKFENKLIYEGFVKIMVFNEKQAEMTILVKTGITGNGAMKINKM
jgi:hypothetical protein